MSRSWRGSRDGNTLLTHVPELSWIFFFLTERTGSGNSQPFVIPDLFKDMQLTSDVYLHVWLLQARKLVYEIVHICLNQNWQPIPLFFPSRVFKFGRSVFGSKEIWHVDLGMLVANLWKTFLKLCFSHFPLAYIVIVSVKCHKAKILVEGLLSKLVLRVKSQNVSPIDVNGTLQRRHLEQRSRSYWKYMTQLCNV